MGTVQSYIDQNNKMMIINKFIVSILFVGLSLQAYTEDEEESSFYLTEDNNVVCDYKFVYQTRGTYQYLWGSWVYRTGPFAPNPNYGRYFNDGNIARKSEPKTFNDIVQTIAYKSTDDVCAGIQTIYGTTTTTHPRIPDGTAQTPKDWTGQTIRLITGCSTDRINSLTYDASITGDSPSNCGTSTKGQAYNGYPFQFARDRCHLVYWSGKIVKFTDSKHALTDIYFYW